jgi:hypothetical protein
MDFIETLFHVSPDGGSGMTEVMFLTVPVIVCALLFVHRLRRSRRYAIQSQSDGHGVPPS